jgi:TPR repeat protein
MPDESKDVINRNEIETEYKIDEEESQALYYEAEKLFFLSRRKEDHIDKIIELYKAAADLNNVQAMMAFGRIYELGIGVKPNSSWAYGMYDRAKECGSVHGHWKVAEMWEKN